MAPENEYTFSQIGGRLCLDFTNTAGQHAGSDPDEHLNTYEDLVAWGRQLEVISPRTAKHLAVMAEQDSSRAEACLRRAVDLRESLYRVFSANARKEMPPAADLARVNRELKEALQRQKLVLDEGRYRWTFEGGTGDLDPMLWPVARSAGDLLTIDEGLGRLRECASDTCGWLFIDTSKNHSRRWCDMADCG